MILARDGFWKSKLNARRMEQVESCSVFSDWVGSTTAYTAYKGF